MINININEEERNELNVKGTSLWEIVNLCHIIARLSDNMEQITGWKITRKSVTNLILSSELEGVIVEE